MISLCCGSNKGLIFRDALSLIKYILYCGSIVGFDFCSAFCTYVRISQFGIVLCNDALGVDFASGDLALRKAIHRALHDASFAVESFRFNVAVARVMELVNATRKAIDSGCGPADPAVREAVEAIAIMLSLVAPFTAEEMWERLGHKPCVALAGWPAVDEKLLVADAVTVVVQINGKIKDRLDVAPSITDADLEAAALALPSIVAALSGATINKIITRAPKLVNIVINN